MKLCVNLWTFESFFLSCSRKSFMRNVALTPTSFLYSFGYSRMFFGIFPLTFPRLLYRDRAFFFHVVASNPSRGLLTRIEDRSPFGATTWEKRRTKVPLVFHIETTARASSEHFFAKSVGKPRYYRHMQLTNYIDDDSR